MWAEKPVTGSDTLSADSKWDRDSGIVDLSGALIPYIALYFCGCLMFPYIFHNLPYIFNIFIVD